MQNKIDRLISNGNFEFSEQRNVVASLIEYSRCLDLYDIIDRSYRIQLHEVLVRIAICYDILGNFNKTIDYLGKALNIVPNVGSLILYRSVLLQTLGKTDEAHKTLVKYKQISGKKKMDLYETFRLVFYYSMQLEKEVLLREINEYLDKYNKNAVVLYLRAMIYHDLSNSNSNQSSHSQSSVNQSQTTYYTTSNYNLKYESDIKEAMQLEPHDTEFLMKDGIKNENLTKLFFMIVPDMDFYQPNALVNYKTFHSGMKLFYVLIKTIKMFKLKVEKKKLKNFYNNKLKLLRKRAENSKSGIDISDTSNNYSNNSLINTQNQNENKDLINLKLFSYEGSGSGNSNAQNKTSFTGNTSDIGENKENRNNKETKDKESNQLNKISKTKLNNNLTTDRVNNVKINKNPTIVNIKNNFENANIEDTINEIKKEYEMKVRNLYKSVWLYNIRKNSQHYNIEVDLDTNYFIKNKYYAPYNLKETLIMGIKQNIEYKNVTDTEKDSPQQKFRLSSKRQLGTNYKNFSNPQIMPSQRIITSQNYNSMKNQEIVADLSVSEINQKPMNFDDQDTMSFSSDINFLDNEGNRNKKTNEKKEDPAKSNQSSTKNLKKTEQNKLRLQKMTTELIKNEVLNTKKFIHKPSPRMDFLRLNMITNKFTSLSREKKNVTESASKINMNLNTNMMVPHTTYTNNNSNNLTNNSNINSHSVNNKNEINVNNYNEAKPQHTGQISIRKSLEFNKMKITEDLLKKEATGKPVMFKNLPKNFNSKISNLISTKIKRSDSTISSGSNVKTNENI